MRKTFGQSYNVKKLLRFMTFTIIYSSAVTWMNVSFLKGMFAIDTIFFTLVGVILSLFLVFRINTSYDRWWEGRCAWGKLMADSRALAMNIDSLLEDSNVKQRNFFVKSISNFAIALQWHLRDEAKTGELIFVNNAYSQALEKADHVPNAILSFMYREIGVMGRDELYTDRDKTQLKGQLQDFVSVLTDCERIHNTPIPFSHSTFIKIFAMTYIFILPYGLVDNFQYLTIPCVVIMAFAMFGVEIISEEIENPFGMDANDLPTGHMSDVIRENVHEILKVKLEYKRTKKISSEAEVLH